MYYLIYKMGAVLEYINIYTIYSQISLIYIIWGLEFSYNSPGSSQKWVLIFFRGASTGAPVLMKKW